MAKTALADTDAARAAATDTASSDGTAEAGRQEESSRGTPPAAASRRLGRRRNRGRSQRSGTRVGARTTCPRRAFVAPSILALVVLGAYPLVFTIIAAVTESSLGRPFQEFVGTETIEDVLTDGDVTASLVRGIVYAVLVSVVSVVLGVATAVALSRSVRSGAVVRTLLLLPMITPPVVVGILWKMIFNPSGGLLDTVLGAVLPGTGPVSVLSHPFLSLAGVALADVWEWTPLIVLLVFAALLGQDPEVTEAAALDGAHGLRLFRTITLPAIAATVGAAFLIRLVLGFKVFDLVYVMTSGGPGQATAVPAYLIWKSALQNFDVGHAAVITLLLAIVVTLVTLPVVAITRRLHND